MYQFATGPPPHGAMLMPKSLRAGSEHISSSPNATPRLFCRDCLTYNYLLLRLLFCRIDARSCSPGHIRGRCDSEFPTFNLLSLPSQYEEHMLLVALLLLCAIVNSAWAGTATTTVSLSLTPLQSGDSLASSYRGIMTVKKEPVVCILLRMLE
jgi:hypothetical protein